VIPSGFIILALLLNCFGAGTYIYKVLRRRVQPHIVTWSMWAFAPYVAFFAQLSDGVGVQSLLTLFSGTSPLIVVVILLILHEQIWTVTAFDIVCGALSILGIAVWLLSRQAQYAVIFAIAADAFASIPTYRKAWRDPGSESRVNFGCLAVSALITLATIKVWSLSQVAFAAYLVVLGASLVGVLLTARHVRQGRVQPAAPEGQKG
jgi:hypothetical protein